MHTPVSVEIYIYKIYECLEIWPPNYYLKKVSGVVEVPTGTLIRFYFHTVLPTLGILIFKFLPDKWNTTSHYFDLYFLEFKKLSIVTCL